MTIAEMLSQSGVLTLLGMGIVFGFLIIMIAAITITGKIIHGLGLDKDAPVSGGAARPASGGSSASGGSNARGAAEVTAAISAAVKEYRKN